MRVRYDGNSAHQVLLSSFRSVLKVHRDVYAPTTSRCTPTSHRDFVFFRASQHRKAWRSTLRRSTTTKPSELPSACGPIHPHCHDAHFLSFATGRTSQATQPQARKPPHRRRTVAATDNPPSISQKRFTVQISALSSCSSVRSFPSCCRVSFQFLVQSSNPAPP